MKEGKPKLKIKNSMVSLSRLRFLLSPFRFSFNAGISLVEIIIYVALLGGISVFIANFLVHTVNSYYRARAEREVVSNARLLLETVNKSIAEAQAIYAPTSRFNIDAGQLSLMTAAASTTGHVVGYLDYYADNGRFYVRSEGSQAQAISASSVRVTRFFLERITQSIGREAVKITLQVDYARPKFTSSIILNSTTALRGNY